MRAVPAGETSDLRFNFVSVTNLAKPSAGHMRSLVIHFVDADHFTQT
jgi:hypothetical protein